MSPKTSADFLKAMEWLFSKKKNKNYKIQSCLKFLAAFYQNKKK